MTVQRAQGSQAHDGSQGQWAQGHLLISTGQTHSHILRTGLLHPRKASCPSPSPEHWEDAGEQGSSLLCGGLDDCSCWSLLLESHQMPRVKVAGTSSLGTHFAASCSTHGASGGRVGSLT